MLCFVALFTGCWIFFATVFIAFISLQKLVQQHCPLAKELFLAEKKWALPVPAMLQGITTSSYLSPSK